VICSSKIYCKEKYEGKQKANANSMKLGGGKYFRYGAYLEGITVENHEGNSLAVKELA